MKSFNYNIFDCLKWCQRKDIFKIKFKNTTHEYYLNSIQVSNDFKHVIALCFVKSDFDVDEFFRKFNSKEEDEDFDEDEYFLPHVRNNEIVFVVSTGSVEDALDALYEESKDLVKGYKKKTVNIEHCERQTKIRDILNSEKNGSL